MERVVLSCGCFRGASSQSVVPIALRPVGRYDIMVGVAHITAGKQKREGRDGVLSSPSRMLTTMTYITQ